MSRSAEQGLYLVLALEDACAVARRASIGGDAGRLIATLEAIGSSATSFARVIEALRALEGHAALRLEAEADGR